MNKRPEKDGVGQLVLQIVFPEGSTRDGTEETEDNGLAASSSSSAVGKKPERKRKWYSLIDKVYALPNLQRAWTCVAGSESQPASAGFRAPRSALH